MSPSTASVVIPSRLWCIGCIFWMWNTRNAY